MASFPRCQIVPLPEHQVSIRIDGRERLRWHHGQEYPRPFFYPLVGPSGAALTRMGHPGAPNHDHHRSIWFAHNKVLGIDFWSDNTPARIEQLMWLVYDEGDDAARMATRLRWYDGHDPQHLLEQDAIVSVMPYEDDEVLVELQLTLTPKAETLEFGQTNFGFLAVRVAKSISAHFGGGELTNSEGARSEANTFGKPARWMDYSGPVQSADGTIVTEGITYFDHPSNPNHPVHWHVRADGWMGASVCMNGPVETSQASPLQLRYLLHAHRGDAAPMRAERVFQQFTKIPLLKVIRSKQPHRQFEIVSGIG